MKCKHGEILYGNRCLTCERESSVTSDYKIPTDKHECLQPIYDYCKEIKNGEPERAEEIAEICLKLCCALENIPGRSIL